MKTLFLIIIMGFWLLSSIFWSHLGGTNSESRPGGPVRQPDTSGAGGTNDDLDKIIDELDKELKPIPVEEEIDVIGILNKVIDKMESAEDRLSSASNLKPEEPTVTDTNKAKRRQQEIIDELNKLFHQIKNAQSSAADDLDKIIRSAKVYEQNEQKKQSKRPRPKPEQKPKPQQKESPKDDGPAPRAYDAKGDLPDHFIPRRSDALKWGKLPPKLRDEIIQSAQEEFLPEYQERLSRYFKILAGNQE